MSFTQYIEYFTCKKCGKVHFRKDVKTDDYGFPVKGETYTCECGNENDFNYKLLDRCSFTCPVCEKTITFMEGTIPNISYLHEKQPIEIYWGFIITPLGTKLSALKARRLDDSS